MCIRDSSATGYCPPTPYPVLKQAQIGDAPTSHACTVLRNARYQERVWCYAMSGTEKGYVTAQCVVVRRANGLSMFYVLFAPASGAWYPLPPPHDLGPGP
eukprot:1697245-Rhodomonas_salina.2